MLFFQSVLRYKRVINQLPHNDRYLQESHLVQEAAKVGDDFGASREFLPHVVVENQVQVALAVSCFL